jgi:hypothetical protein
MPKKKRMSHPKKVLLSVIIGLAVISFWRGAWNLMDIYLFPNNYEASSWLSLILGFAILIATHHAIKELM